MSWSTGSPFVGGSAGGGGGGGGGFANPATEDLDMNSNDITGVGGLSMASGAPGYVTGLTNQHLAIVAGGAVYQACLTDDRGLSGSNGVFVNRNGVVIAHPGGNAVEVSNTGVTTFNNNVVVGDCTIAAADGGVTTDGPVTVGGLSELNGGVRFGSTVAITAGVGAPTTLTSSHQGRLVTNTGTTVKAACTLPAGPSVGAFYDFLCDDSDGLRVVANTNQVITCGALGDSATAGYIETVRQESGLRLTYTASNVWRATRIEGTWRKDSTTSAGFAFTPTAPTAWTPTSATWLANVEFTGLYVHHGWAITSQIQVICKGTPTTASLTVNNWAGGFSPSATKNLGNRSTGDYLIPLFLGVAMDASAGVVRQISAAWSHSDDTVYFFCPLDSAATNVTQAAPFTWAGDAGDPEDDDHLAVTATYYVD